MSDMNIDGSKELVIEEITEKDVSNAWSRMFFAHAIPQSMDRYIAASLMWALKPILQKLYKDDNQLRDALQRHMLFYNSQATWGSGPIVGIMSSLEMGRAKEELKGEEITVTDDAIYGVKAGLMGAMAGVGDSIDEGVVLPIIVAIFLPMSQAGNPLGPIIPWIIFGLWQYLLGLYFAKMGFRLGREAATEILASERSQTFLDGLSIVGLAMMGVLAGSYISISSTLEVPLAGDEVFVLQETLDQILPGLLPLSAVLLIYTYFRHKEFNMIKAIIALSLVLAILALIGIL